MKPHDWANLIWYSLLALTLVVAIIWVVYSSRKRKGRLARLLRRAGNWIKIFFSRMGTELGRLFTRPSVRRREELEDRRKVEEYRRKVLLRFVCPVCRHKLLSIPSVPPADEQRGTKYYCLNCGYERVEGEEEAVDSAGK